MKRFFIYAPVIACLLPSCSFAQRTVDVEKTDMPLNAFFSVGGEPFLNLKFVRLTEGSPYFRDEWLPATATAANGTTYKARHVKLDLFDNEIHYLDSSGNEMIATPALKGLLLTDSASDKAYRFVQASALPAAPPKRGWYLQLASGKASLYCYSQKLLSESRPYGSATSEQRIATVNEFYLVTPIFVRQVKGPKDLVVLLTDKSSELEAWLKTKTGNRQPAAEQLTALVTYYNSLHD